MHARMDGSTRGHGGKLCEASDARSREGRRARCVCTMKRHMVGTMSVVLDEARTHSHGFQTTKNTSDTELLEWRTLYLAFYVPKGHGKGGKWCTMHDSFLRSRSMCLNSPRCKRMVKWKSTVGATGNALENDPCTINRDTVLGSMKQEAMHASQPCTNPPTFSLRVVELRGLPR